jgi:hypothetical protein
VTKSASGLQHVPSVNVHAASAGEILDRTSAHDAIVQSQTGKHTDDAANATPFARDPRPATAAESNAPVVKNGVAPSSIEHQ